MSESEKIGLTIGLSYAAGYYSSSFEDFIDDAARRGFQSVQLIPDQTPNLLAELSKTRVSDLRQRIVEYGIDVSVHNVFYDVNMLSMVPEVAKNSLMITESALKLASALGSRTLTIHPGYMYPGWRNDSNQSKAFWHNAEARLRKLSEVASEYKTRPLFENGSYHLTDKRGQQLTPLHVGIELEELLRVLDACGGDCGVCFDVGKARASGIDVDKFVSEFGGKIGEVQFSRLSDLEATTAALSSAVELSDITFFYEGRDEQVINLLTASMGHKSDP